MKQLNRHVKSRLRTAPRFEPQILSPVPYRPELENQLENLKARLLPTLVSADAEASSAPVRLAANEAASLAWVTPFPLLFFPALLEEKVGAALRREARQQLIRAQTGDFIAQALAE